MKRLTTEGGQVTVLVVGLSLVAFAVAGIAIDGTRAFLARRTLQNAADSSALAGASEIDRRAYYASGGRVVALQPAAARDVAAQWLSKRGLAARATIASDESGVVVRLSDEVDTGFLGLVGMRYIPVAAEAAAEPLAGTS